MQRFVHNPEILHRVFYEFFSDSKLKLLFHPHVPSTNHNECSIVDLVTLYIFLLNKLVRFHQQIFLQMDQEDLLNIFKFKNYNNAKTVLCDVVLFDTSYKHISKLWLIQKFIFIKQIGFEIKNLRKRSFLIRFLAQSTKNYKKNY